MNAEQPLYWVTSFLRNGSYVRPKLGGQIADQIEEWFESYSCDGFIIRTSYAPAGVDEFVRLMIPELRRRNLIRTDYECTTLRNHLHLSRPDRNAWRKR